MKNIQRNEMISVDFCPTKLKSIYLYIYIYLRKVKGKLYNAKVIIGFTFVYNM